MKPTRKRKTVPRTAVEPEPLVLWLVMQCVPSWPITGGQTMPVKWADGMVGAAPLFGDEKSAEKYAKMSGARVVPVKALKGVQRPR